jgi:hypothetical protein
MKVWMLSIILVISACTYSGGRGAVNEQDCSQVQRECVRGVYSEWFQANNELACSCSGQY